MVWAIALCLCVRTPAAEEGAVAELKIQLQQLREEFARTRQEQEQRIHELTQKLDALAGLTPGASTSTQPKADDQDLLARQLAAELGTSPAAVVGPAPRGVNVVPTESYAGRPMAPATRAGPAYMNVSYGTLIDAGWSTEADPARRLQLGDHDPIKRGFTLPNAEITFDGAVDPYFQGFASIVLKLDRNNETEIELEETYVQSTALPANLQLKAGQYFASFGRQNPQHPHAWAFVDQPLILSRAFGPDGLRSIGAQLSWLAPTPFYTEVFMGVFDGEGGTGFSFRHPGEPDASGVPRFAGRATVDHPLRSARDLLFVPRIAISTQLTDTQTLLAGFSAALGPNEPGPDSRTSIYGADIYWKWRPANATRGFPYVSWQAEALYRRFEAAIDPLAPVPLPAETLRDYGWYSQLLFGFAPRWNAGLRADWVNSNAGVFDSEDPFRGRRHRISPELTFFPSEFSKVRLQYNFDQGTLLGTARSIWMQLEFGIGAHAAHKF